VTPLVGWRRSKRRGFDCVRLMTSFLHHSRSCAGDGVRRGLGGAPLMGTVYARHACSEFRRHPVVSALFVLVRAAGSRRSGDAPGHAAVSAAKPSEGASDN